MILRQYETSYTQMGKHRKRCQECNRLIQDGEKVLARQYKTEKMYPVKGIMAFTKWKFMHTECEGEK